MEDYYQVHAQLHSSLSSKPLFSTSPVSLKLLGPVLYVLHISTLTRSPGGSCPGNSRRFHQAARVLITPHLFNQQLKSQRNLVSSTNMHEVLIWARRRARFWKRERQVFVVTRRRNDPQAQSYVTSAASIPGAPAGS